MKNSEIHKMGDNAITAGEAGHHAHFLENIINEFSLTRQYRGNLMKNACATLNFEGQYDPSGLNGDAENIPAYLALGRDSKTNAELRIKTATDIILSADQAEEICAKNNCAPNDLKALRDAPILPPSVRTTFKNMARVIGLHKDHISSNEAKKRLSGAFDLHFNMLNYAEKTFPETGITTTLTPNPHI